MTEPHGSQVPDAERAETEPCVTAAQLDSPEGRAAYARYLVSVGREAEIPYLVGEVESDEPAGGHRIAIRLIEPDHWTQRGE